MKVYHFNVTQAYHIFLGSVCLVNHIGHQSTEVESPECMKDCKENREKQCFQLKLSDITFSVAEQSKHR